VLRAGGAYVPVDPSWPAARVRTVLEHSGAHALIGDPWPQSDAALPDGVHLVPVAAPGDAGSPLGPDDAGPPDGIGGPLDRTAYVIYTSGSTGTPKGVVIAHGAAVNTLRDLTDRFRLTARDKVLAVSSLAFDLSVFDQFALLGCGGTVVCPPDSAHPDPQAWAETVHQHGVTVWNSVPALLALTLEYFGEQARELLASLRLIMLSGDWVPPALVERLADVCPGAEVIAMGGATEASIWSNWFPAAELPADWQSVPYGVPLANQTMHVLDAAMADVPTWVPGDLYIGGAGLATAYLNDPERTAASFVHHPGTGERLYRTGDRARYRPGGILEFLGRADHQVKINGYRVELGEIEAVLAKLPGIRTAVALVDTAAGEPFLAAFVTRGSAAADPEPGTAPGAVRAHDEDALRTELSRVLPAYMVPAAVLDIPELPLSGNGKVDRKALLALLTDTARQAPADTGGAGTATAPSAEPPATEQESRLLRLWRELLGESVRGVRDDFFACGGNSLTAVRLFRSIETVFGRRLPLASLFRNRTVRAQAALLTTGGIADARTPGDDTGPLVGFGGSGVQHVVLVHPVGGDVLCYREVLAAVEACPDTTARVSLHGLRAAGLHQGEELAGGLATMAKHYARTLLERLPEGPLHLVGWSMGGTVALHTAVLLEREGRPVTSLTTVDAFVGRPDGCTQALDARLAGFFGDLTGRGDITAHLPAVRPDAPDSERLREAHDALLAAEVLERPVEPAELARLFTVYRNNSEILERHTPTPWQPEPRPDVPSPAWLSIRAEHTRRDAFPGLLPLDEVLGRTRQTLTVPEDHYSVVQGQAALRLADRIRRVTAAAHAAELPEGARG
jgi:amino acid adenylation domain-containing protein